ncbi:MAG: ABC-F family ATP-binding cassette domain-containing protein [Lachnospiraceae bacterium]|nr:ABC-F family ATP-binding cassette domain-containing protein [Lachnospiraceae bacterium]
MILGCHHISKSYLEVPVLTDVTFTLEKGDRAAIVGINGAGKTTLLRIIMGEEEADSGSITLQKDTTVGYLAQKQNVNSENTILEELLSVKKPVIDMEQKIAEYEQRMNTAEGDELIRMVEDYTELRRRFELEEGYGYRSEVQGVLNGLGFTEEEASRRISHLSGGQKTRTALGKLLLQKPDIIILDEPTNHLDIGSIRWLESYLGSYRGTVLIVSHDRYFMDRIAGKVIELENTRSSVFSGNYSAYAEKKQKLREEQMRAYLNNQAEIRHQEEVIAKLLSFNREKSIKRAFSREKMLDRMERVEKPVEIRDEMHISLKPCIRSGNDVLDIEHLHMAFGPDELFRDLSFSIKRGEHVALIGDNGTGKTTILKIINGIISPLSGRIRTGVNVHIGYYDQELHVLNPANTVFEEIREAHPDMNNTEIRNLLASFLFTGEDVFKRIDSLSGGEKGRVSLAKLMLSEANFLILDEPTNHLDMVSKEVLENALNSYEGTVFYVSHDRYFINRTASRILSLHDRVLTAYPGNGETDSPARFIGNYDFYLEKSAELENGASRLSASEDTPVNSGKSTAGAKTGETAKGIPDSAMDWKKQKEEQARIRKQENDLKKLEKKIAETEEAVRALEETMALPENSTDVARLTELGTKHGELSSLLEELYDTWTGLAE